MESNDETSPPKRIKLSNDTNTTSSADNETPSTCATTQSPDDKIENANASASHPQYPRKFVSVFSSNQAIHKLTERIVVSYAQREKEEAAAAAAAAAKEQEKAMSDETLKESTKRVRKDSDEIQVTDSNLTNPFIAYPHPRHLCGVYPFEKNDGDADDDQDDKNTHRELFCDNCFCKVCDIPARQCLKWKNDHCHACDEPKWQSQRMATLAGNSTGTNVICLDDTDDDDENDNGNDNANENGERAETSEPMTVEEYLEANNHDINQIIASIERRQRAEMENNGKEEDSDMDEYGHEYHMNSFDHHYFDERGDPEMIGQKQRKDARITEVLAHNLRQLNNLSIAKSSTEARSGSGSTGTGTGDVTVQVNKMDGDVPQLNLHKSFFVEGVRIGWPYPVIMPPQRQMAIHLTKAFKNKRHVVIESPTGTGKSAAILCSALAWQRYDAKTNDFGERTKIIYCSRTHSQVQQMVASLKKTPYRPRMAILGSRERLCIHKELRPRSKVIGNSNTRKNRVNINLGCNIRIGNAESLRKYSMKSGHGVAYDDDHPPLSHPGDCDDEPGNEDAEDEAQNDNDGDDDDDENRGLLSKKAKMCPHYRQLSSKSIAEKAYATFVPQRPKVDCCSIGGDKTKLGAHDIEDLVNFGKQPNIKRGVALYREPSKPSFGLKLGQARDSRESIAINEIVEGGAAEKEGTIQEDDVLVSVNGVDVTGGHHLSNVVQKIKDAKDPLLLDVYSGETEGVHIDTDEYSHHAACPYYLSRILAKDADLVFCPYNYVLDPRIRAAMEIEVEDAVVVLDEAHNVEDTLRQEGSGKFGEIELLEMNVLLSSHARRWQPRDGSLDYGRRQKEESLHDKMPGIAHDILVFLDSIISFMRGARDRFEKNQGKNGVTSATREYQKFKSPDDKEFEMDYYGPSGSGDGRNPIGCKGFFTKLNVDEKIIAHIKSQMSLLHEYMTSNRGGNQSAQRNSTLADRLKELVYTLCDAFKLSEHYYISTCISANGNLDFATGAGDGNNDDRFHRFKKNPRPFPQNPAITVNNPSPRPRPCNHPDCSKRSNGTISHDTYCNGSTPRWESHLVINLLTPGILMAPLLRDCRSVVLASGSLAPLGSLCAELHLLPPSGPQGKKPQIQDEKNTNNVEQKEVDNDDPLSQTSGRLQVTPKPLEANHVVSLPKQLFAVGIGHFPDGSPLSVKMSNYSKAGFHDKLGNTIATIIECIPRGGVLVFFPSFSFLRKCVSTWQNSSTWNRLLVSKGDVVVEPSSSQSEFEEARNRFNSTIEITGNCILLAVFRGKMSEGVSFNDDYARGVICVGVPFPSSYDRSISAKMSYNNEQRRFRKKGLLAGSEWYSQQAYRAIAQAIGRCIRHAADYGTIILLDSRHCDDGHSYNQQGVCRAHANLPKWMRSSVRTLRKDMRPVGRNDLLGGWQNLKREMRTFFEGAAIHGDKVLEKQKQDFQRMQRNSDLSQDVSFDHKTRKWSMSQSTVLSQSQSPSEK